MRQLFSRFFRRHRASTPAASAFLLAIGTTHACDVDEDACRRSRTCVPGAIGVESQLSGGAPTDDGSPAGGTAGEGGGGLGGAAQGGAGSSNPTHQEGDPCQPSGKYTCAAHAKRVQLVCIDGAFAPYGTCKSLERCDTRPETEGLCQPVVPECLGHQGGEGVCRGNERLICGADLVTAESLGTCPSGCVDGVCTECSPDAAPTCEFNSRRSCTPTGDWDLTSCPAETPHCSQGECGAPPSCQNLPATCGKDENEPCCTSLLVTGGNFDRNNDPALPATISSFRLDRFEVTVGRFRRFKEAWDAGWRPDGGSGKHVHLNGGLGLVDGTKASGFERGWYESLTTIVQPTDENLDGPETTPDPFATWTEGAASNETRPINFVNHVEAYAFCIWDGGFLPSDAEWSYAASGGAEQREYPWGSELPSLELAVYGCGPLGQTCVESIPAVGLTRGKGLFDQLDLGGNVAEQTLGSSTPSTCADCVEFPTMGGAPVRGGGFSSADTHLSNASAGTVQGMSTRNAQAGLRCARAR